MALLAVGRTHPFKAVRDAVAAARPYDEIVIDGIVEEADCIQIRIPLTLTGASPDAAILVRGLLHGGKGVLCTHADAMVRKLEFRNARALTGNAAGIWHENGNLTLEKCRFVENQNGVMAACAPHDNVSVSRCSFVRNGAGCGHTHGIYGSRLGTLRIEECHFEDTAVGHHVKSRARVLRVARRHFAGRTGCTASYAIDVANGGLVSIQRNQFIKGRNAMSRAFISYSSEGLTHADNGIEVESNIFINHRRGPVAAVVNRAASVAAVLHGNAYERVAFGLLGRGRQRRKQDAQEAIAVGVV